MKIKPKKNYYSYNTTNPIVVFIDLINYFVNLLHDF